MTRYIARPRSALILAGAFPLIFGVLVLCAAPDAIAQTTSGNGGTVTLPGSGPQPSVKPGQTCVQVQIQGVKPNPYDCLNQQLQSQVQGTNPGSPSLPLSANSPSNKVGTFNEQGLAQQYGQNLGKSVTPYRPPAPVFSNSVHP
jgi:hypothetical protein